MNRIEKTGLFLWVISAMAYFTTDNIDSSTIILIVCLVGWGIFYFSGKE